VLSACAGPTNANSGPCTPCPQVAATGAAPLQPRSAKLDQLGQERVDVAKARIPVLRLYFVRGAISPAEFLAAFRGVAFAARESGLRGEALRSALTEYRDHAKEALESQRQRVATGAQTGDSLNQMKEGVLEAEYWLAEASQRPLW
jgi:hypothetical protein